MDWREYLRIAQNLHDNKGDLATAEACCRASISRSFFAAFNLAAIRLKTAERGTPAYGGSQQKVIEYYSQHPNKTRSKIGSKLDRLKDLRAESDYEYYYGKKAINDYPSASGNSLKNAASIIGLIDSL